ncbi:MAG: hypothetical protein WBP26_03125 [Candidatus Saccharimonadales bacterium]
MLQIIILLGIIAIIVILLIEKGILAKIPGLGGRRIVLDSCALIDGRIVELVKSGFVADELIIPKFILRELQALADGADSHKRERARFGLETAVSLQEITKVTIDDADYANTLKTDDKLIILTKERKGALCTTDYNLNKVASVEGVRVLNVNELSQALRPIALPGEQHTIKIVQKGSNKNQGVGYLDDGTMIVVENGAKYIGKTVIVIMDHMLQTVAGKMAFAKLKGVEQEQAGRRTADIPVAPNANPVANPKKTAVLAGLTRRRAIARPRSDSQLERSLLRANQTRQTTRQSSDTRKIM